MFGLGPFYIFVLSQRLPTGMPRTYRRERASVYWTDLAIAAIAIVMGLTIGIKEFLMVQLAITLIGSTLGVWLSMSSISSRAHTGPGMTGGILRRLL